MSPDHTDVIVAVEAVMYTVEFTNAVYLLHLDHAKDSAAVTTITLLFGDTTTSATHLSENTEAAHRCPLRVITIKVLQPLWARLMLHRVMQVVETIMVVLHGLEAEAPPCITPHRVALAGSLHVEATSVTMKAVSGRRLVVVRRYPTKISIGIIRLLPMHGIHHRIVTIIGIVLVRLRILRNDQCTRRTLTV